MRALERALASVVVLWLALSLGWLLMRAAPGSPWSSERGLDQAGVNAAKERFALSYGQFMTGVVKGDLGWSWRYQDRKVGEIIRTALPTSAELGGWALLLALLIGVPAGCLAAVGKGTKWDAMASTMVVLGTTVPNFVLAPLAQEWIGLPLGYVAGWEGWEPRALAASVLALAQAAFVARLTRNSLIEVLDEDWIRSAQAKGLSPFRILFRHALPSVMLPVVQYIAPTAATLLTGTLVVEQVFAIPGLGRHFVQSALQRDVPVALGVLFVYSALLLALNSVSDLLVLWLDPRLRESPK